MKIIAIIPARLSSKRLPRKQLLKIGDSNLIEIIYKKLSKIFSKKNIFVATSKNKSDDELCNFCEKKKINFFRGSLTNVTKRVYELAKYQKADGFIRVNGDSPLVNLPQLKKSILKFKSKKYDLVTNVFPRTFPKGMSIEIIRTEILKKVLEKNKKKSHKEHITSYIYENSKHFKILNMKSNLDYSKIHLAVDTYKDFQKIKKIILKQNKLGFSLNRIIREYEKN